MRGYVCPLVGRSVDCSITQTLRSRKTDDSDVKLSFSFSRSIFHEFILSFIQNVHSLKTFIHSFLISEAHILAIIWPCSSCERLNLWTIVCLLKNHCFIHLCQSAESEFVKNHLFVTNYCLIILFQYTESEFVDNRLSVNNHCLINLFQSTESEFVDHCLSNKSHFFINLF